MQLDYANIMYSLMGGETVLPEDAQRTRGLQLLKDGTLPVVARVMFTSSTRSEWASLDYDSFVFDSVYVTSALLREAIASHREVETGFLTLDRNTQFRLTVALSRLLLDQLCLHQNHHVTYCALQFGSFLLRTSGSEAFAAFAAFVG